MKTISISKHLCIGLGAPLAVSPCKRYNELPKVEREDVSSRAYRLEESKPMNEEDLARLKQIQDEYKQNAQ